MKLVNLTSGNLVSKRVIWDETIPCTIGNAISSYYSACESSSVPPHFNYGNHSYIVGKNYIYRTEWSANRQILTENMCIDNWEALPINDRDLKTLLSEEEWGTLSTKVTYVRCENRIQQIEVLAFDRDVTWHFGVVALGKCFYEDEILLEEGKFLFTEKETFYRKNNDEYYQIWENSIEIFEIENVEYKIAQLKENYCLFACFEGSYYGYEFSSETGLNKALEGIGKKIQSDSLNRIDLGKAIQLLSDNQTILTIEDSYAVGNCETGTKIFVDKYFKGLTEFTIPKGSESYVLDIAEKYPLFAKVLKYKSQFLGDIGIRYRVICKENFIPNKHTSITFIRSKVKPFNGISFEKLQPYSLPGDLAENLYERLKGSTFNYSHGDLIEL